MSEPRPSPAGIGHRLRRAIVIWLVAALALYLLNGILPGMELREPGAALVAAALIGLINAVVWPLLIRFALPFTVLTLGLGVLVLNGAIVLLVAQIDTGFHINDLWTGIVVAVGLTLVNTVVTAILSVDDDDAFLRNVVRRQARRTKTEVETDVPGLFFLEIDGLAHDVLARAIRDGNAPTMARWVRDGNHRLIRWETDWSSQTGACQAGLLHGSNVDMPAFRWWEKDRQAAMVTNHPKDAMEIERRHSDGRGLLYADGASRANIVSGDAPHSLLTMSTVMRKDRTGRLGQDYYAYFAGPYNVARTIILVLAEMASELWSASQQRRADVQPRIHRSVVYAGMRAWATVIQRDLQVSAILGDLFSGRPVAYTTFLGYDEVAHHSGIERPDTLSTLRRIDKVFGRIERAAQHAPRPYHFVVLSDHGQSQGATFLDRYGESLEGLVTRVCHADDVQAETSGGDQAAGYLGASLTEAVQNDSAPARAVRRATRNRSVGGEVRIGEGDGAPPDGPAGDQPPEVVVMASGCLGLISFPRMRGRVTLEQLDAAYPDLVGALRDHPGVGFVLVRSERDGALVIGASGTRHLDDDRIEGEDPAGAVRAQRRRPRPADRRLHALRRHHGQQHLLGADRRGRRLRGARGLPRGDGRDAGLPVRPRPHRVRDPRGGGGRPRGHAPPHAPLAGRPGPGRLPGRRGGLIRRRLHCRGGPAARSRLPVHLMRRTRPLIRSVCATLIGLAVVTAGCGSDTAEPPPPKVQLSVSSPRDTSVVTADAVELSGRVRPPEAEVEVLGRPAEVSAGRFSARVALEVGTTVVDVIATAPDRSPALTAIRVTRQALVEVPDVTGDSPEDARRQLVAAGLAVTIKDFVGPLEGLLPVDTTVCGTDPAAGTEVTRGTTVQVSVAKLC